MTTDGPDGCDPCKCVPPGIGSVIQTYRYWVVKILCLIYQATSTKSSAQTLTKTAQTTGSSGDIQLSDTELLTVSLQVQPHDNTTTLYQVDLEIATVLSGTIIWSKIATLTESDAGYTSITGVLAAGVRASVISSDGTGVDYTLGLL